MPGIEYQLETIPGIEEGGKLLVFGPNIMKGFYFLEAPGKNAPPENGWYDTGDIVTVDSEGYIHINGRAKRFAKIGGEMVSLTAVENYVNQVWPDYVHAAIQIPDPKKGEKIVVITNYQEANRITLVTYVKQNGISELSLPKKILMVD